MVIAGAAAFGTGFGVLQNLTLSLITRGYLPALLVAYRKGASRVAEVDLSGGAELELGREPALA